jgi:hypothetical protein
MSDLVGTITGTAVSVRPTPSAQAWFAGGERVGYDPKARAIVTAQGAPLKKRTGAAASGWLAG